MADIQSAAEKRKQQGNKLFSKEALDKMRSPERLDTMLAVTTPIVWMSLGAIVMITCSILLWSVYGSFTVKAEGMGLIMDSAGIVNVSHVASGKLERLYVRTGSHVHKGDLIAHIEQPEQSAETRMAQYGTGLAGSDREAMRQVYEFDAKRHRQNVAEDIYSDYDGIIDEIMVEEGGLVSGGEPVCTIRLNEGRSDLTGIFYVSVENGKRVESGMSIQLAPNGVDVSQSGSLLGVVRSVSQYPVSSASVQQHLGNAHLAQYILTAQKSSVMEVTFDLVRDPNSPSGYLWTSTVGEHKPITAGSFCKGSIIIERQPPIEKVFYKLSQWLRSR